MKDTVKNWLKDSGHRILAAILAFATPLGLMLIRKYFREHIAPPVELAILIVSFIGAVVALPQRSFYT